MFEQAGAVQTTDKSDRERISAEQSQQWLSRQKPANLMSECIQRRPGMHSSFISLGTGPCRRVKASRRIEQRWSTYQKPGGTGSKDMERTAARIAALLEKEMTPATAGAEKK